MKKTIILLNIFLLPLLISSNSVAQEIYSAVNAHSQSNYYSEDFQETKKSEKVCSEHFGLCKNENVSLLIPGELANLPAKILDMSKDEVSGLETFKIILPDGRVKENIPGSHLCGSKEVCLNDEVLIKVTNSELNSKFFVLSKTIGFENDQILTSALKVFTRQNQVETISILKVDPQLVAKSVLCMKGFCIGDNELYKKFESLQTGWKVLRIFDNNTIEVMIRSTSYLMSLDSFLQTMFGSRSTFNFEDLLNLRRLPLYYNSMADRLRDERLMLRASKKTENAFTRQQNSQNRRSMSLLHQQAAEFNRSLSARTKILNEGRKVRLDENRETQRYQLNSIEYYEKQELLKINEQMIKSNSKFLDKADSIIRDIKRIKRSKD